MKPHRQTLNSIQLSHFHTSHYSLFLNNVQSAPFLFRATTTTYTILQTKQTVSPPIHTSRYSLYHHLFLHTDSQPCTTSSQIFLSQPPRLPFTPLAQIHGKRQIESNSPPVNTSTPSNVNSSSLPSPLPNLIPRLTTICSLIRLNTRLITNVGEPLISATMTTCQAFLIWHCKLTTNILISMIHNIEHKPHYSSAKRVRAPRIPSRSAFNLPARDLVMGTSIPFPKDAACLFFSFPPRPPASFLLNIEPKPLPSSPPTRYMPHLAINLVSSISDNAPH
ncbi:hypothetical protein GALMADRAFT_154758 [Galerina marginata CBS 339.88]|uniref:Uncharacterized protein n=1 Tax=Galerina marginata (strain CBS 339.88) TaxID=685588 RepID=A0A067T6T8_GALM3|nr:hypothetical protein GALMADRAFT_154758 [Galerina marginata CBS 339.88]